MTDYESTLYCSTRCSNEAVSKENPQFQRDDGNDDDNQAIGELGEHFIIDYIRTQKDFTVYQLPEGSLFDAWLGRSNHGVCIAEQKGIGLQIKSRHCNSLSWKTTHEGDTGANARRHWAAYQGGLLCHVIVAAANVELALPAWRSQKAVSSLPLPSLTMEQHALNAYYFIPFNRPTIQPTLPYHATARQRINFSRLPPPFAITLPPYVMKLYDVNGDSYTTRFSAGNCWKLTPTDSAASTSILTTICTDVYGQFTRMTFNKARWQVGRTHFVEHFGHGLMHVLMYQLGVGQFHWCRVNVGSDFYLAGCPCEAKSAVVQSESAIRAGRMTWPAGIWAEKDFTNLRSGRVRALMAHRLHHSPAPDDVQLDVIIVPWYCIQGCVGRDAAVKQQLLLSEHVIDETTFTSTDALAPFRMNLGDKNACSHIQRVLLDAYPLSDRAASSDDEILARINPDWAQFDVPGVLNPFVFLHPTEDDITTMQGNLADRVRTLVGKAQRGLISSIEHIHIPAEQWTYTNSNGSPWTIPSGFTRDNPVREAMMAKMRIPGGWPKNTVITCPGPGYSESHPQTHSIGHRHQSMPDLQRCVKHIVPGKSIGGQRWFDTTDGTYEPSTEPRQLGKWKNKHTECEQCHRR
jgi:hypothetical protein